MTLPTVTVQLDDASNGGTFPYDISAYVRLPDGVAMHQGREDEFGDVQPSTLSLTLENTDGRFTLGSTTGGYGAVNIDRRIRVFFSGSVPTTLKFTGYVQAWPVEWPDGSDTFALARITAVDALARLSRKTLRSVIEEEILLDAPFAYYTLGEATGATSAGESSGNGAAALGQTGSGAAVTFGSATGPGTDSLTAATFNGGKYLTTQRPTDPASAMTLECFVSTTHTGLPSNMLYLHGLAMWIDGTGHINADQPGAITIVSGGPVINDGNVHHIALTYDAAKLGTLYVDGVAAGSGTGTVLPSGASDPLCAVGTNASPFSFSHVAWYNTALSATRIAAHSTAGRTGFAGEDTVARITRLASYAGITATGSSPSNTSVPFVDFTGDSPASAIEKVAQAEGAPVYIDSTGLMQVESRNARAAVAVVLTLTNDDIDPSVEVAADMQLVENVVTASAGANGAVQVAVAASSRAVHGDYPADLTGLLVSTDDQALYAAQWRVGKYAEPFRRIPNLSLDLTTLSFAIQNVVRHIHISDRVQITGMPSQAGSSTLDLIVEGWTETLTHDSWTWEANTSNFAAASAWILDSATYSVLDSTTTLSY